jgi:hypothetical protein
VSLLERPAAAGGEKFESLLRAGCRLLSAAAGEEAVG